MRRNYAPYWCRPVSSVLLRLISISSSLSHSSQLHHSPLNRSTVPRLAPVWVPSGRVPSSSPSVPLSRSWVRIRSVPCVTALAFGPSAPLSAGSPSRLDPIGPVSSGPGVCAVWSRQPVRSGPRSVPGAGGSAPLPGQMAALRLMVRRAPAAVTRPCPRRRRSGLAKPADNSNCRR